MFEGFKPDAIKFLRQLEKNNNRDWFAENKSRYEQVVLFPALELVADLVKPIERVSPCFTAVAKRSGGSVMRIYRDVRFSKNKLPYKTNLGLHFRHLKGKDVHAPGFYFHVSPSEIFFGAGIWCPPTPDVAKIRQAIDEDPDRWKKLWKTKAMRTQFEQQGESLKRPPRGFDKEHPLIDDLKRKDHIVVTQMESSDLLDRQLINKLTKNIKSSMAYVRFLCDALHLPS